MKKYLGDATLKGNLDVLSDKPLDSRLVVQNKEDLYTLDSRYVYEGMPVSCINEASIYILIDKTNVGSPLGWRKVSASTNILVISKEEYDRLTHYEEDILYFVYEPRTWKLGEGLPMILSDNLWGFGNGLPIILS